jgi:hypothetical protein
MQSSQQQQKFALLHLNVLIRLIKCEFIVFCEYYELVYKVN